ncbi:hypothetical protein BH11PLA1_BH11PLA1_07610 [soil metagenome]
MFIGLTLAAASFAGLGAAALLARELPPPPPAAPAMPTAEPAKPANAETKPAPATAPAGAMRPAVCDVYKIADKMTRADRFQKDMKDKQSELEDRIKPLAADLDALTKTLKDVPEDKRKGTEWDQMYSDFMKKRTEMSTLEETARKEYLDFITAKNYEVYKLVLSSVDAVATSRGYTHVFNSRALDDADKPTSPQGFTQGLLARPLIKFPAGDDITLDVMKDLKVD